MFKPAKKLQLYPIQEKIVNACRDEMKINKKIILQAATGIGKTIVSTWIIKQAEKKGLKILFICDRISLIDQTSNVFHDYGIQHGIYQADNPLYDPEMQVQLGSIQTLSRRKQRDYDLIIIDEVHTFFKAHEKIINHNKDSFIIGLSATPFTAGLGKYFHKHIEPVPMRQLIDEKYLCDFEIYGPDTIDLSKVRTVAGDYREDDLSIAADKPQLVADVVETWIKLANDMKTIVFAVNVAHAKHLEKVFNQKRVPVKEINGYMPKEGPGGANQIIQDFRDNKFKVLISVEMLVKGFDVPDVECIVFATATKSIMKWIQAVGRGLRTFDGKTMCRILDHGSNAERLGFPDEYEFEELDDGKKSDSKTKKKDKKEEKLPKKCPSCDFLKPAGIRKCPACGFEPAYLEDVETIDGKLKKIERKKPGKYSIGDKQSFLSQLNQYAAEKGYKQGGKGCFGWALHKYKAFFGVMPSNKIRWNDREAVTSEVNKFITHENIKYAKRKNQ